MPRVYHIVTNRELRRMEASRLEGYSLRSIAKGIGCDHTTVRRHTKHIPQSGIIRERMKNIASLREQALRAQWVVDIALKVYPEARL